MLNQKKIIVVLPAYNAALTLEKTYKEIPFDTVDEVILVDDASEDNTIKTGKQLGINYIVGHDKNKGYDGSIFLGQKLNEYHAGYRAFSVEVLRTIHFMENSDDFIFDNEMLSRIITRGYEIAEITCPTLYSGETSGIGFRNGTI